MNYCGGRCGGRGVVGWILRRRAARHGDLPSEYLPARVIGSVRRRLDATSILPDMVASAGDVAGPPGADLMAGPGAPLDREQAQLVVLVPAVLMLFSR